MAEKLGEEIIVTVPYRETVTTNCGYGVYVLYLPRYSSSRAILIAAQDAVLGIGLHVNYRINDETGGNFCFKMTSGNLTFENRAASDQTVKIRRLSVI